jgi:hypothetical protein
MFDAANSLLVLGIVLWLSEGSRKLRGLPEAVSGPIVVWWALVLAQFVSAWCFQHGRWPLLAVPLTTLNGLVSLGRVFLGLGCLWLAYEDWTAIGWLLCLPGVGLLLAAFCGACGWVKAVERWVYGSASPVQALPSSPENAGPGETVARPHDGVRGGGGVR